jgi:2-polyprenyl-6-hydroxyphenyl methylase/3-demethylubiquinone-9 3-methyltransferase
VRTDHHRPRRPWLPGPTNRPGTTGAPAEHRPRNDPRQYDDLASDWWRPDGPFAALHWIAEARRDLIPPPPSGTGVLLDIGCGGGLLAPHVPDGYRHVGVDLSPPALRWAASHGVVAVLGDALALPFDDATFDVVVAGEILEHVDDVAAAVCEICRVLRPSGTVIIDTIADTRWARFSLVTVAERLPGGPPPRCHDPELFVDPAALRDLFGQRGVQLRLHGLAPRPLEYLRFVLTRRGRVRMRTVRSLSGLYAGVGVKRPGVHQTCCHGRAPAT